VGDQICYEKIIHFCNNFFLLQKWMIFVLRKLSVTKEGFPMNLILKMIQIEKKSDPNLNFIVYFRTLLTGDYLQRFIFTLLTAFYFFLDHF
jgi:hypothetical protein